MQVLILKTNQIQNVKDSYAVNYLIPKGLAKVATDHLLKEIESNQVQKQTENLKKKKQQEELCRQLEGKTYQLRLKANSEGHLYAALGENQIKKLFKTKIPLEIVSSIIIKQVGSHQVKIKIGSYRCGVNLVIIAQ